MSVSGCEVDHVRWLGLLGEPHQSKKAECCTFVVGSICLSRERFADTTRFDC